MATPNWRPAPMTEGVLRQIFESDQAMYPAPLTYGRLQSWSHTCPDLSQCFYVTDPEADSQGGYGELAGAVIALPLRETSWRDLLSGKLRETDIEASAMFPCSNSTASPVGLHVFHIERFGDRPRGFASRSLVHIQEVAKSKGWDVLGCSGRPYMSQPCRQKRN